MAQLVLGVVGAVVGGYFGGPAGAQAGFLIGSALGGAIEGSKPQQNFDTPLTDLKVPGTEYGQSIPLVYGHVRTAGQIVYASAKRPIPHYSESEGKGGGGEVQTLHYTYEVDLLILLANVPGKYPARIWKNGELIYNKLVSASVETRDASDETDAWVRITPYPGASTQMPDPTYEAAVGTANALGYRGQSSVFIQSLDLGTSGQLPLLSFELADPTDGSGGEVLLVHFNGTEGQTTATDEVGNGTFQFNGNAHIDADHVLLGGQTAYFDGNLDSIGISTSGDLQTFWGVGETFTGEFMFENDGALPSTVGVLMGFTTNLATSELVCYLTSAGHAEPNFIYCEVPALVDSIRIPHVIDSDPHWVRFSYDGTTFRFSLDGVEGDTQTGTLADSFVTGITLGKNPAGNSDFFKGWIKEIRITQDRARPSNYEVPTEQFVLGDGLVFDQIDVDVEDAVSDLCMRGGLSSSQFDVTDLAAITRQVRGLALPVMPTRQALDLLGAVFFFDVTVSDKIYFIARGGSAVATIPYEDLGASETGDPNVEPLELRFNNEIEMPAQIALSYQNFLADYQSGTELSDRLITALDNSVEERRVSIVMIPSEAKQVADVWLMDRYASAFETEIGLLGDYVRLEPTDPVVATDRLGNTFRLRMLERTDNYPMLGYRAVLDDVSVLSSQGITDADYTPQTDVSAPAETLLVLMDIPILRDVDDEPGPYAAAKGVTTPWPGCAVLKSSDDIDFEEVEAITESAVIGETTTALGDWTGSRVFDEMNSVTVDVGAGTLSSTTRAAILDSQAVNAMLIGSEIIQFRKATLQSPGIYKLTGLLRGSRGTEWARTGHGADERCVLLRTRGLRKIDLETFELGVEKFWRGVTLGRKLSTADSQEFTCEGIGMKPFSPFDLRADRDGSNNITFTMQRRTRYAVRMIGPLGVSVPLGEDVADFELDIMGDDSPGETVLRTLQHVSVTGTLVTFEYSAADQTTDGLTPGDPVTGWGYQLSDVVGRGYVHERTV